MLDGGQLARLNSWAADIMETMAPVERKRLLRKMAVELRKSNQKRIRQNVSPDGGQFERRTSKPSNGRIRSGRMFRKMPRLMKTKVTANKLEIGFAGQTGRIATIHQFGHSEPPDDGYPAVRYPVRALLGINAKDQQMLNGILVDYLNQL